MREKVTAIIAREFDLPECDIHPSDSIRLLSTDSLEFVYLCQELESTFGIDIPDEDMQKFFTVGDVISYLESK